MEKSSLCPNEADMFSIHSKGVEILHAKYNSELLSDGPFLIYTALKAHWKPYME